MGKAYTGKLKVVSDDMLIVAVDIGMEMNRGYCTTPDGRSSKTFKFDNTRVGMDTLWDMIMISKNRFKCSQVIVGYESTGPYGEPMLHYLAKMPVKVVQVNPMHTKKVKELNDNSPLKTDDKDPRVIADIIRWGHALSIVIPEGDAAYLRRLNNSRERHVRERTALVNQLQQLVFLLFPEFKKVMKDIKCRTPLYLLKKYPTPEAISVLDKQLLGEEMRKRSRGKFKEQHADMLISLAKNTIGIREGVLGLSMDIQHILIQLEMLKNLISEIESEMGIALGRIHYSSKLLSIKGLGVVSVAGIIGEIGDFNKFKTRSEIMKLAGLDLYEISSGKMKGQRRISKRGRSLLRKILYYTAIQTIRKNGIMYDYYTRLTGRGMKKMMALVAVSRKLLGIIYAIVRDDSEYSINFKKKQVIKKAA
ncbi:MAG: IS110 family transposase [Proteobacteria bacterium]|nr:IS110 family transposase [Pseudomonadota bacterium]